jgi:hypothetical protein
VTSANLVLGEISHREALHCVRITPSSPTLTKYRLTLAEEADTVVVTADS